ncbi:MAG: lysophospholipase [Prevotella sp.]|nr:lysophospholipase [Prevotella sp.]
MKQLLALLLALAPLVSHAQTVDDGESRAEQLFGYLLRNQSDSLYDALAEKVKPLLKRVQLKDALAQAEALAGKYVKHGPWTSSDVADSRVYQSTVTFKNAELTALIGLDPGGRMTAIRLMPPMVLTPEVDDMPLPNDAVETDDTVRTSPLIRLPATITLSGRSPQPPMVVMVHGSGALDRNETVMGNQTFRDLARQLADRGISSLRYDKRSFVYPSQPVSSMDDETTLDALAAIALARTYSNKVYLLGHSLGAMMAPVIASRADKGQLSGIIMLAATARPMLDVVNEQLQHLASADTTTITTQTDIEQVIGEVRRQSPHYFEPQHQVETAQVLSLPILVMQGGRDYQVTMADFQLWQQALGHRSNVTLLSFPDLNHLFLPGTGTSTPQEYLIRQSIPSPVIDAIEHFILQ